MSLEWCLLRNDLSPKPHLTSLVLGQLPRFSWDMFPNVPEVIPQTCLGHLPTSPHTDWQLVSPSKGPVFVPGPHVDVPISLWERLLPQTLHTCLFTVCTPKMELCFGLALYFLLLLNNPVLKHQSEAALSKLPTLRWLRPNSITHFPLKQAAAGWNRRCLCGLQSNNFLSRSLGCHWRHIPDFCRQRRQSFIQFFWGDMPSTAAAEVLAGGGCQCLGSSWVSECWKTNKGFVSVLPVAMVCSGRGQGRACSVPSSVLRMDGERLQHCSFC